LVSPCPFDPDSRDGDLHELPSGFVPSRGDASAAAYWPCSLDAVTATQVNFDDGDLDQLGVAARSAGVFRDENRRMLALLNCLKADVDWADRKELLKLVLPTTEQLKHNLSRLVAVRLGGPPTPDGALAYLDESISSPADVRIVLESKQGAAINYTGAVHTRIRSRLPGRYISSNNYPDPSPRANDQWHDGAPSGWTCCSPGHTQPRKGGDVRCGLPQGDFYRVWNWLPPDLQMTDPDTATWLVLHEGARQSPFKDLATSSDWADREWAGIGNDAYRLLKARVSARPAAFSSSWQRFTSRLGALLRSMLDPYGPGRPVRLPGRAWVGMRTGLDRLWVANGSHLEHRDRASVVIINAHGQFEIVDRAGRAADPGEVADWHAAILEAGCRLPGDPCTYALCADPIGVAGDCGHVDNDGYRGPGTMPAP